MTFRGVSTAIVTPFNRQGGIDEGRLRAIVDRQIEAGIAGLVPMGTTGESPTLDHEEHTHVIEVVVEQADGRVPVIAGTGSNSTAEAVEMTKYAAEIGADASLQVAPYYNKPSQEGFYRHFAAVAEAVDIPLIIYNIPGRSGKNIENETMLRLAAIPGIQGVKEASGDIRQIMDLIARKPDDFAVLSGDDNIAYPMTALGGDGLISVASNLVPERVVEMIDLALNGRMEEARKSHYDLLPLFNALFFDTNPIPIKYAMAKKGFLEESYRLPMCPMTDDLKRKVDEVLDRLGI